LSISVQGLSNLHHKSFSDLLGVFTSAIFPGSFSFQQSAVDIWWSGVVKKILS
jgi:hypothetical protein